eukprot:GHVL01011908.1.p1 GENE.GHVL01011908.1~~GHVL01011908.1.p1  ORF type:complete len:249 (-),score=45.51 GHVL01011908.1:566-1312(-)
MSFKGRSHWNLLQQRRQQTPNKTFTGNSEITDKYSINNTSPPLIQYANTYQNLIPQTASLQSVNVLNKNIAPSVKIDEYYCKVCDRGFRTQNSLQLHITNEHVRCLVPNCSFSGPPNVMASHELRHTTNSQGLCILESPEEIEKWRIARKLNFPTKDNINKKNENSCKEKNSKITSKIEEALCRANCLKRDKNDIKKEKNEKISKKRKRSSTPLLNELLKKEINDYHLQILQALRYLVDKNFFETQDI